jgi:hypothetical protein
MMSSILKTSICENPCCFASFVVEYKNQTYCLTCRDKLKRMGLEPEINKPDGVKK